MEQRRRRPYRALTAGLVLVAVAGAAWGILRPRGPTHPRIPDVRIPDTVGITVEVLNGSGRAGLARVATRALRQLGFDVLFFGTAPDSVSSTEVLARRGDSLAAALVARALGMGRVRVARDTLLRLDVTVLLGVDYKP